MSKASQKYVDFVAAMNARDWSAAQACIADTVIANDAETPNSALMEGIKGLVGAGPDMHTTFDLVVDDDAGEMAYSRVIHRLTFVQDAMGATVTGKPLEFAEATVYSAKDGKVAKVYNIFDTDAISSGQETQFRTPSIEAAPAPAGFNLKAAFDRYVTSLNKNTYESVFPELVHDEVFSNGKTITRQELMDMYASGHARVDNLTYNVSDTVVNTGKQQVGARTIVKGNMPGSGKSVEWVNHWFLQFDGGKVRQLVILNDVMGMRTSMSN